MAMRKLLGLPGRCASCGAAVLLWTPWGWVNEDTHEPHRCTEGD